jgi:hypothetical protein
VVLLFFYIIFKLIGQFDKVRLEPKDCWPNVVVDDSDIIIREPVYIIKQKKKKKKNKQLKYFDCFKCNNYRFLKSQFITLLLWIKYTNKYWAAENNI